MDRFSGNPFGYPRHGAAFNAAQTASAAEHAAIVAPAIREAQAARAKSLRAIAAVLNEKSIPTARGGRWEAAQVRNILRRAG